MKYLSIIFLCILCLILSSKQVWVKDTKVRDKVSISTSFTMEILNDEKLCNDELVVGLKIFDYRGKIHAEWKHIYIKLLNGGIAARIQLYTSFNDTISDVLVDENYFQFILHFGKGKTVKIKGTKKIVDYYVEGTGSWWSDLLNKKVKVKWHSIDKDIIPLLREVFLISL